VQRKHPYLEKMEKEAAEGRNEAHFWVRYTPAVFGMFVPPAAAGIDYPFWLPFSYLILLEICYWSTNERRLPFSFLFILPWLWYYSQFGIDGLGSYLEILSVPMVLASIALIWRIRRTVTRHKHGMHAANDE
jgi:hypothetical protein